MPRRRRQSAPLGGGCPQTFTDIAAFDEAIGKLRFGKVPTNRPRCADGIAAGAAKPRPVAAVTSLLDRVRKPQFAGADAARKRFAASSAEMTMF